MTSRLREKDDSRGYPLSSLIPRPLSMDPREAWDEPDYPFSCSAQSITGSTSSFVGHRKQEKYGWLARLGQPPPEQQGR